MDPSDLYRGNPRLFLLQKSMKQIITIKEVRKILGKQAKEMSDDQIRDIILDLQKLAKKFINNTGSKL